MMEKQLHAALSAGKSSDNPFVECNFERNVCQEVAPLNFFLIFAKEIKQCLQIAAPESFDSKFKLLSSFPFLSCNDIIHVWVWGSEGVYPPRRTNF